MPLTPWPAARGNPKSESRNPKQTRNPNTETGRPISDFGFPDSDFPAQRERGTTALRLGMAFALYAIPVLVSLWAVTDPDIWWHLRTGQWVVAHGTVPATDPFSLPGLHKPWVA